MAFATANVRKGVMGNLNVTAGDWSGSQADADGTITVSGGRVYFAQFSDQDSSGSPVQMAPWWISATGTNTVTISIGNRSSVSTGRFLIVHA